MDTGQNERADRVTAVATGLGAGFVAFMLAWIVGARLTERLWGQPSAAVVALLFAMALGALTSLLVSRRLLRTLATERQHPAQPQVIAIAHRSASSS